MSELPAVLDACCGGRMCWFDKRHPDVLFIDIRREPKGHMEVRPNHAVEPDMVADYRAMPFPDSSFSLVLFDPPHMLKRNGKLGLMARRYGDLNRESWEEDISKGFSECMRVLRPAGTLVFKWSEKEIPLKKVLGLFSQKPLFGHHTNKNSTTHWLVFMKASR